MRKKKLLVVGLFVMNIASSALAGGGGGDWGFHGNYATVE